MRLDKFLSITGTATRSESSRAVRSGRVTVNGLGAKSADIKIDPENDTVCFDGVRVVYREFTYIMLNKPTGYVSATDDKNLPTVLELLPDELRRLNLFPAGRLDRDTVGLMLLTDDGVLAHFLLSPVSHVPKSYRFTAQSLLSKSDVSALESGVDIGEDHITKPSSLTVESDGASGVITISEGRYHQIKRMFEAVGNKITSLERIAFGPLVLDPSLSRGEWRFLTSDEIKELQKHNRNTNGETK